MKKFVAIWLLLAASGCAAIQDLEDAAAALNDAEKQLDKLDVSGCMDVCSDNAEICLQRANGNCVDACEDEEDACDLVFDGCFDNIKVSCLPFEGADYLSCIEDGHDYCDKDCDRAAGNCNQECGEDAQDCLVGGDDAGFQVGEVSFADCMSACIDEMESTLQEIDL